MYFDSSCKINNNGKISGYHRSGKYDDDKVVYFVNEEYGEPLKLSFLKVKKPPTPTPPSKQDNKKDFKSMNDQEILNYCETQTQETKILKQHEQIKSVIRKYINEQLERYGAVDDDVLKDFHFVVENLKNTDLSLANEWQKLKAIYKVK